MGAGRLKNISIPLLVEISPPTSNPVGGALLFPTLSRLGVHLVEPAFRTITRNVRPFVPFERLKIFRKLLRENGSGSMDNRASSVSKAEKFFPHNSPRIELTPRGADFPSELYRPRLNYRSSDDRISPLRSFHNRKLNLNYCCLFLFSLLLLLLLLFY